MAVQFAPDLATMRRLVAVATGVVAADRVVHGGSLVNVFTEEILSGWGVVVTDGRIANIGPDVERFEAADRIPASGTDRGTGRRA